MKTISLAQIRADASGYRQVAEVLGAGGLVCFPAQSGYKLAVDVGSPQAITAMLQAKRRVKNAPALVFVPDDSWVSSVADPVSDEARTLMRAFWPGPLTLLFKASESLHPKVRRPLTKAKGWLGVRVPDDEVALGVIRAFGKPVLVSSANLASKHGAQSLAQVKKNFGRTVDLLIEDGDINVGPSSTLVDVSKGAASVLRAGAVSEDDVLGALAG